MKYLSRTIAILLLVNIIATHLLFQTSGDESSSTNQSDTKDTTTKKKNVFERLLGKAKDEVSPETKVEKESTTAVSYTPLKPTTTDSEVKLSSPFILNNVNQWILYLSDDFSYETEDWNFQGRTKCNNVTMLGGHCLKIPGMITKTIKNIPIHTQIRIKCNYHYLDDWRGETGYMLVQDSNDFSHDPKFSERHFEWNGEKNNICGGKMSDSKFSQIVDAFAYHTEDELIVSFGSTLNVDPCVASFGISFFELYIR